MEFTKRQKVSAGKHMTLELFGGARWLTAEAISTLQNTEAKSVTLRGTFL
jgi:hypothetical protein